jgi:CheY-like chemotaxis protein
MLRETQRNTATKRKISRILVVDDDPLVRAVTSRVLRFKGYDVSEAVSGQSAIRFLASRCFDLIITDLMMPGMSGSELVTEIREAKKSLIPVILMSGSGADVLKSLNFENSRTLAKPYEIEDLLDCVLAFERA